MREGIDCKGRKWVERELKGTAKDITGQTYESLTAGLSQRYHRLAMSMSMRQSIDN